jgi:L-lactate dehydrogenase (cytochrome)
MKLRSSDDLFRAASRRLPPFLAEYIHGGSYAEHTLRRNVGDLAAIELRQRVLNDVSNIDLRATLFGTEWSLPVGLGPIGISGMFARRGEVQAATAAERANIPFCLSTVSICSLEEVRAALARPFWFQLYMIRDRGFMSELLDRAAAAGCSCLLFTVDMPVPGVRYRDFRSGMSGSTGWRARTRRTGRRCADHVGPSTLRSAAGRTRLGNLVQVLGTRSGLDDYVGWLGRNFDPSVTWRDLDWVRTKWNRPLVIKGILDVDDARSAADCGADGIVVSNHGGRQFDGVRSTARALPAIAAAVGGRLTVLADGGVRSGLDVLRMLALGAHGALLGRAWAYALAAGGHNYVAAMIDTLARELSAAMAMAGCTSIAAIDGSLLDR